MKPCRILSACVLALLCLLSSAARAQVATEFSAGISAGSFPTGITSGPDGNLWFTEEGTGGGLATGGGIGRITPLGVVTEFKSGVVAGFSAAAQPWGITVGSDANLWFSDINLSRIGRITPAGVVTEFIAGITPGAQIHGITLGPDGNVWFTEYNTNKVGRITPAGVVTEFNTGLTGGGLQGIVAGPDGALWFAEAAGCKIGRITTAGVITEFSASFDSAAGPYGITAGPDGNLWYTEASVSASPPRIGRITTAGVVTEFPLPTVGTVPTGITAGADGNLWFAEQAGDAIGRITTAGVATEFTAGITRPGAAPFGITTGPDGNLWFTELTGNRIGRITFPPPALVSAVSRKTHGAAGTFDLPLSTVPTNPTTEPRQGATATIVMSFDSAVISANAAVTEGTAIAGTPTFSGKDVTVILSGVTDLHYVTVSLTNVASSTVSGGSGSVRLGFLVGDVNQNRVVSLADLAIINAQLAQTVTAANYLKDLNASGTLSLADKAIANASLTKSLPSP